MRLVKLNRSLERSRKTARPQFLHTECARRGGKTKAEWVRMGFNTVEWH